MKTTIHLPDDLVARAKAVALERNSSLRALVERGLRREIEAADPGTLERVLASLREVAPELWENVDADAYVDEQRTGWNG
jgi:predicted transcriptional regulator